MRKEEEEEDARKGQKHDPHVTTCVVPAFSSINALFAGASAAVGVLFPPPFAHIFPANLQFESAALSS